MYLGKMPNKLMLLRDFTECSLAKIRPRCNQYRKHAVFTQISRRQALKNGLKNYVCRGSCVIGFKRYIKIK